MKELLTTNERIGKLEEKVDSVLKLLKPDSDEQNDNKELFEKFDEFKKEMVIYLDGLKKSSESEFDYSEDDENPNFNRNMWYFTLIGLLLSISLSVISYQVSMPMFPFAFSLLFTFGSLKLFLLIDKYMLKGDTIGRISKNANSAVRFLFIGAIFIVAGFHFGTSFLSDPFGGEESNSKQEQIRYIENPAPSRSSDELRLGNGEASED